MSPSALHSTNPPALPPFLRVKIATMERNRKDLLVRFDASVRRFFDGWSELPQGEPSGVGGR
jgi:hypothetical protein